MSDMSKGEKLRQQMLAMSATEPTLHTLTPASEGLVTDAMIEAVERIAWSIPAPNDWTPQLIQITSSAKIAAAKARHIGEEAMTQSTEQER